MNRRLLWAVWPLWLLAIVPWTFAAAPAPNPGAVELVLKGGDSGDVPFPHRRHQERLLDCTVCHSVFPQKAGAIEELKSQGKLQKKEVMNTQCTKCHKERRRGGETTGPTTCTSCHSIK
jgi:hypothetical protein